MGWFPPPQPAQPHQPRRVLKVTTNIPFPTFSEADRVDVEKWFKEFDRVAMHVGQGQEMEPSEYVTMLISSTEKDSLAGKRLRKLKDKDGMYQQLEAKNDHQSCRTLMIQELYRLQKSEFVNDTNVSDKFEELQFNPGDDILTYHTAWEDVNFDLEHSGLQRNEKTLLMDHKRKFKDKDALGLVLRTEKPETVEELMEALEAHFEVGETLRDGEKAPRVRQRRQRWDDPHQALGSLGAGKGGAGKGKGHWDSGKAGPPVKPSPPAPTDQRQDVCVGFAKKGACRFGDNCKFSHNKRRCEGWLKEQAEKGGGPSPSPWKAPAPGPPAKKEVCIYFAKSGKCKFGDKCYGSHEKRKVDEWLKKQKDVQAGTQRQSNQQQGHPDPKATGKPPAVPAIPNKAGASGSLFSTNRRVTCSEEDE